MWRGILRFLGLFVGLTIGAVPAASAQDGTRSFYMGFTPHPYDFTDEAFADTYDLINAHGDIIGHHLDEGVPWIEALEGRPYDANVEADLQRRLTGTAPGKAVFLSITPLALSRQGLAQNWAADSHMANPGDFDAAPLDSPQVKTAFTAYALDMIDRFKPKYFAYAIEISDLVSVPEVRVQFVGLAAHVYAEVKARHPDLMAFPTYTLGDRGYLGPEMRDLMQELAPYTDVVAVSTYAYVWDGIGGTAANLPADWFTKLADVLPGKPFAVSETGFLAGDYANPAFGVLISATPDDQRAYVDRLLTDAEALKAEFVIWYVPVDYDLLWEKMKAIGMDQWFAQWMRSGLWDAGRNRRPALELWSEWYARPLASP